MEQIDVERWPRREAFEFFSGMSNPFYMVSFRQDVTGLYDFAKSNGLSFYYCMIWACTRAMNEVEAFRVAIRDGRPVLLARREPSFTDLRPGAEQFHIVTMAAGEDVRTFCREAAERSRAQRGFIDLSSESDALIYFSCLPWIDLTALTNERDLSAPGARDDGIPRLAWGRFTEERGRRALGLSIEVNHRLIDGLHIGQFAQGLSAVIAGLNEAGAASPAERGEI